MSPGFDAAAITSKCGVDGFDDGRPFRGRFRRLARGSGRLASNGCGGRRCRRGTRRRVLTMALPGCRLGLGASTKAHFPRAMIWTAFMDLELRLAVKANWRGV